MSETADALRAFNRFYTRQIGLLDQSYLESEMSLTEVRILYEIHGGKRNAREIAQYLFLDEGYLSRVLARFAKQGLIDRSQSKKDARQTDLALSKTGSVKIAELISRSGAAIEVQISGLTVADRAELVRATDTIERCLSNTALQPPLVQLRDLKIGDLGLIASRHGVLYAQEHGFDETFEILVAGILAEFVQSRILAKERAWVATRGGQVLGSIFCVHVSDEVAKLRLFYLEPTARGLGLGWEMLTACLEFARAAGYRKMVLWTHESHPAACALYQKAGFKMIKATQVHNFGQDLVEQEWRVDL